MKTKQNNPTRIYRTVSVEDRLPNGTGTGDYTVVFKDGSMSSDTDVYCDGVVAWLEEVELPTDEEIYSEAGKNSTRTYLAFERGASFILNHIKGGR